LRRLLRLCRPVLAALSLILHLASAFRPEANGHRRRGGEWGDGWLVFGVLQSSMTTELH
jgi:hypothetical protein